MKNNQHKELFKIAKQTAKKLNNNPFKALEVADILIFMSFMQIIEKGMKKEKVIESIRALCGSLEERIESMDKEAQDEKIA